MRPVVKVSWDNVQQYVRWISKLTGHRYRLLSETEWEFASRGVTSIESHVSAYSWGNDIGVGNANCTGCSEERSINRSVPVGSFKPNAFGLFDMHGNVSEWVQDCWHEDYTNAPQDESARDDCSNNRRVIRGGSWGDTSDHARSAWRGRFSSDLRVSFIGFRLARSPTAEKNDLQWPWPLQKTPSQPVEERVDQETLDALDKIFEDILKEHNQKDPR